MRRTENGTARSNSATGRLERPAGGTSASVALGDALARAEAARAAVLATRTNAEIIDALACAAAKWREHRAPEYGETVTALAEAASLDRDMIAHGLDLTFEALTRRALTSLLAEAEDAGALERPRIDPDGVGRRLFGPRRIVHLLAGNVPGLSIAPIAAGLLARSVLVFRESRRQPGLTRAFAATLERIDAELARTIVAAYWPHDDRRAEQLVCTPDARVEIYGSDATVATIHDRTSARAAESVLRGTRTSVAIVADGADLDLAARGFAKDAVLYDGLGCLSPHIVFVEGSQQRTRAFARRLADALDDYEVRWPRRRRDFEIEAGRRAWITQVEARALAAGGDVLRGANDAWVVAAQATPAPPATGPGLRCLRVVPVPELYRIPALLAHAGAPLAAAGLAWPEEAAGREAFERALREAGATLVTAPGRMQAPPLGWRQDGRARLGDLLSWSVVP